MISNIYYDTPIYTFEGITKAARDFAVALDMEFNVMLSDTKVQDIFDFDYTYMYNPIDLHPANNLPHIYLRNTRPESLHTIFSENLFFYHVFEGDKLIQSQVKTLNEVENLKCVFFPSTHNANIAKASGLTKPIEVVPHIIGEKFTPKRRTDYNKTTFYYSGAIFGITNKDRKGIDLILQAWKKYENDDDKILTLKINPIYAENIYKSQGYKFDTKEYLTKVYGKELPKNITIITTNLTEQGIINIYNAVDCILYPSRGEGFGLVPFEGLACGTPCIVTEGLGPDEYLQHLDGKGHLTIKVEKLVSPEKRFPYYDPKTKEETMWWEPDFKHFEEQIAYFIENKDKLKKEAGEVSNIIHEKYTTKNISKLFRKYFDKYTNVKEEKEENERNNNTKDNKNN